MPFTTAEFLDSLRRYNDAVWPAQWLLMALAAAGALVTLRGGRRGTDARASRLVSALLAALWLWTGLVYHLGFFRAINPAAAGFAALFVAQAALFAWSGAWRGRLHFRAGLDAPGVVGALLLFWALVGYPVLALAFGHRYPATPTFGLPCPTTIYTFGVLAWTRPTPRSVLIVPALWAVVGGSAALLLGMHEDVTLPAAAALYALGVTASPLRPWTTRLSRSAH